MIRILVADDERLEREALQFIAGQLPDLETEVFLAANGQEAVDLARRLQPDIAILDIKMPVLGGIEAARQIREDVPHARVVFLTAFDHFAYAQEAIRLQADDFIIKPADNDRIAEVIRRLGAETPGGRRLSRHSDTTELAEAKLITDAILGNVDEEMLRRFLGVELGESVLTMASVIRVREDGQSSDARSPQLDRTIRRRILSALRTEAGADGISVLGSTEQSVLYVLLAAAGHRSEASALFSMEQTMDSALERLSDEFGMDAIAGIDAPQHGFHGLGLRFANAKVASRTDGDGVAGHHVRAYETDTRIDHEGRRELLESERDLLRRILGSDDRQRREATARLLDALRRSGTDPAGFAKEAGQSLAYLVHATGMYVGSVPEGGALVDIQRNGSRRDETIRAFQQAVEQLAAHARATAEGTHTAVTATKNLIDERFSEDLSLEMIAEHVRLSAYHLARIFKTATGSTVLDYLTLVRMDRAKELMRDPSLNLKEIAGRVGYRDQNYFSRVFRRLNGTTPSAFRRAWQ